MPLDLASARQLRRAFAHLRDRAGRRLQRVRVERLDRIDHRDRRLLRLQRWTGFSRARFRRSGAAPTHRAPAASRAARSAATDSSPLTYSTLCCAPIAHSACSISVDLPMPGIAADQHHRAGARARRPARGRIPRCRSAARLSSCASTSDRRCSLPLPASARETVGARRHRFGDGFDQRIPRRAMRALALPFDGLAAAFGAGVNRFGFGHTVDDEVRMPAPAAAAGCAPTVYCAAGVCGGPPGADAAGCG